MATVADVRPCTRGAPPQPPPTERRPCSSSGEASRDRLARGPAWPPCRVFPGRAVQRRPGCRAASCSSILCCPPTIKPVGAGSREKMREAASSPRPGLPPMPAHLIPLRCGGLNNWRRTAKVPWRDPARAAPVRAPRRSHRPPRQPRDDKRACLRFYSPRRRRPRLGYRSPCYCEPGTKSVRPGTR